MTVLVVGPRSAGATSLAVALREYLPEADVAERAEGGAAVVVLAVSAVAPPAASDRAVLDAAIAAGGAVVGTVTKVDAHRCWRDVLAEVSSLYGDIAWFGSSAAPRLGPPDVAAVGTAVRELLEGRGLDDARVRRLRSCRAALVRDHRSVRADRSVALRTGVHRERLALGRFVRDRCARLRSEFRTVAAEMPRGSTDVVERRVRDAADTLMRDVDERVSRRLADLAEGFGVGAPEPSPAHALPEWEGPPSVSRRAERGLTLALGAGFGLGIAMAAGRVFTALAPWLTAAGQAVGALVGLLLTAWLVATRELLHDRAVVDRWVGDVVGSLKGCAEDRVAGRLLDAEACFSGALSARAAGESDRIGRRLAVIDDELRGLTDRKGRSSRF